MGKGAGLGGKEQRALFDLADALGASLDLRRVLTDAYEMLLPLVGADYGALAVTRGARPDDYEWIVQNLPPTFLGSYEDMAPHDFVRNAVIARPNAVLRDSEMVDRRAFERNMMYQRARQVGSPIEQVMAVMLNVDGGWQSGLSLYRERRRPFSEREQLRLQGVTPVIANAVRNCRTFAGVAKRNDVLEALLGDERRAVVIVQTSGMESDRTAQATALLNRWFSSGERKGGALPPLLVTELRQAQGCVAAHIWRRRGTISDLEVKITQVPGRADLWAIVLREEPHTLLPPLRKPLTPSEQKVLSCALSGVDTPFIAVELGCKPNTVKKHFQRIYEKFGVPDRKKLLSLFVRSS